MRPGPLHRGTTQRWDLLDASLTTPAAIAVPAAILELADSNWRTDVAIDVGDPAADVFLTEHRVAALLRTDHVRLHQRDQLRNRLLEIASIQLSIEATANDVLHRCAKAGISLRVLKGLASAELDYPDRSLRESGDVDLAVPRDEFEDCVELLLGAGYQRKDVQHAEPLRKGTTLLSPRGVEVDLHTRLFQRSPLTGTLFDDPAPLAYLLGGLALSAPMRLVHAAGHFILTPPGGRRMSGLVDITMLRKRPDVELGEVREIAADFGIEGLVRAAMELEASLRGDLSDVAAVAGWSGPSWFDRRTRLRPHRNLVLDHFGRFRDIPRGDRLRYLPQWLTPDRRQRRKFAESIAAQRTRKKSR